MNTISEQTNTERKLVPKGTHPGRCISIVDLGTGPETYKGETKMRRTLNITWELPKQTVETDGQPMPMRISKKFTASTDQKLCCDNTSILGLLQQRQSCATLTLRACWAKSAS